MDDIFFTSEEKGFFEAVLAKGLLQPQGYYWSVLRFALALSLRMDGMPDERYGRAKGADRSELHLQQLTGRGTDKDYDDALRLMLSIKHQADLFKSQTEYVDLLQRHFRRGVEAMMRAWQPGRDFHDYLLDELYFNAGSMGQSDDEIVAAPSEDMLKQGLTAIGVKATPAAAPVSGPRLTRFPLTLSGVEDFDRLRRGLEDLSFTLGLGSMSVSMVRESGERRVTVEIPRPSATWHDIRWDDVAPHLNDRLEALPVCPGVDVMGTPFVFDLAEAPHLFVAGATGSGKSVCLNALILSLLAAKRPPTLVMIDPKGLDFADYDGCQSLRDGRVITDMDEGVQLLHAMVDEMESRSAVLRQYQARNIAEAQAAGAALDRIVIIIDELADFLIGKSGAQDPLIRLAQKARASGLHLVLATQRPEAATFPGLLRSNIPSRIALTVQKAADSRIILDEAGAENLLMRGDMLVRIAGRDTRRVHGVRVDRSDILRAVQQSGLKL
ncbi:FtsK/SpoIIIE domain-containing protein [Bosea sp. (in: a-proteobacteria)]